MATYFNSSELNILENTLVFLINPEKRVEKLICHIEAENWKILAKVRNINKHTATAYAFSSGTRQKTNSNIEGLSLAKEERGTNFFREKFSLSFMGDQKFCSHLT